MACMHTHNKAANILKLCVASLDKIEAREQAVKGKEDAFQKGKRKWLQDESQARRGLEAEIMRRLESEVLFPLFIFRLLQNKIAWPQYERNILLNKYKAGVYHMEGADVAIYRKHAAELAVNLERRFVFLCFSYEYTLL